MKELNFLDKPENRKRTIRFFFISLGLLIFIDFFIHKHAELPWEEAPAFFAVYGFVSCVALIFIAKGLRVLIKRKEDYYNT